MTQPLAKPRPPQRLALITPEGLAVYENGKVIAALRTDYQWSPEDVEAARTDDYLPEKAQ